MLVGFDLTLYVFVFTHSTDYFGLVCQSSNVDKDQKVHYSNLIGLFVVLSFHTDFIWKIQKKEMIWNFCCEMEWVLDNDCEQDILVILRATTTECLCVNMCSVWKKIFFFLFKDFREGFIGFLIMKFGEGLIESSLKKGAERNDS